MLAALFTWGYGAADYLTLVFLPTFASKFGHLASGRALAVNTVGEAVAICTIPLAGWLTDRVLRLVRIDRVRLVTVLAEIRA